MAAMKQVLAVAVVVLMVGCTKNELMIQNRSSNVNITLNFRAKEYSIPAGSSDQTISDIPNGTYGYGTIYSAAVADVEMIPGEGLSGEFSFERSSTDALLIYGSYAEWDSAAHKWSITVWAQKSTTDPVGAITGP
jgi:hypothetical protein